MSALADPSTIKRWREQPPLYVRERFGVEPDAWQDEVLADFPASQRQAMTACKGPGKSTVLAWLGWNFLETRPHPKGAATSVTKDNLRDGLWTEMAKWQQRSEALKEQFTWTSTRIFHNPYPETWFLSARTWSKSATSADQEAALAGLHADYIIVLCDETGDYPDAVMAAVDAILSSCKEGHIAQAGNPLKLSGPLYRAVRLERHLWKVYEITGDPDDPNRSPRVSVEWAQQQIDRYGRDNPWVLVNVFGRFPPASLDSLIGPEAIAEATKRSWQETDIDYAARIIGVDVARFGDDASVIFPRQGLVAFTPRLYRNIDTMAGAGAVAAKSHEWQADAIFVDETGGYGAGWIDALRALGQAPIGVQFAGKPNDIRYFNKRAEMYFELAEWIKAGGQLPPIPELGNALTQMTYTYKGDRLLLEDKDQLKTRLGFSPDHADALALTFAQPIAGQRQKRGRHSRHTYDYDPYAEATRAVAETYSPYSS